MTDFDAEDIAAMRREGSLRDFLRMQSRPTTPSAPPPQRPVHRPPGWVPGQWPPGTRPPSRADIDPDEAQAALAEMRAEYRRHLNTTDPEET